VELFGILLDADPNRRRTVPSDEVMDEDVEMELADIATAVSGNDEGSEEEESGDKSGHKADAGDEETDNNGSNLPTSTSEPLLKKQHYCKQNCAQRNRILLFIVSHSTHFMKSSAYLQMKKCVLLVVIIGNSSNECFNALQCTISFFLKSKCAAKVIIELLAHMGISVSTQTICNMVQSLTKSAAE
jgi:hypothetical protein